MNPMTNIKNVLKLSERELGKTGSSWHHQYRSSAWIFVGGLPYNLTEGDIISVFSQYGEIVNINLVRDKVTGKQKGFCFICYEDQRSTDLAVDNFNGIKVLGRTIRVDHCENYKVPQESKKNPIDVETAKLQLEGCAPSLANKIKEEPPDIRDSEGNINLPQMLPIRRNKPKEKTPQEKAKKVKKSKKHKKKKHSSSGSSNS